MLFDSDVVIWSLRGNHKAQSALKEDVYRCINAVTYLEVIRGLKTKERMQWWKSLISELNKNYSHGRDYFHQGHVLE